MSSLDLSLMSFVLHHKWGGIDIKVINSYINSRLFSALFVLSTGMFFM